MKQLLRYTAIVSVFTATLLQLSAQTFTPIPSPNYPFVKAECEGGGNHYILFENGYPNDTDYLYRFDGNNFYLIDSFKISPNGFIYCMAYDNNEIYIGGDFDSLNGNIRSPCLFKYSLSNKTITKSSDIFGVNVIPHAVFDIKKWNNQFLMGGMFEISAKNSPLLVGSGTSWSFFDTRIYRNTVLCELSNTIWKIVIESDSSFYVTGDVKYIDQLEINEVAHWNHGQWNALGNGLPYDHLFGDRWGGMVKQFGKLFVSHKDSANNYLISYFDGNTWNTLNSPSTIAYYLFGHSCGLFAYTGNYALTPNGLVLYNYQLAYTALSGVTTIFLSSIFEHNSNVYVGGRFTYNSQTYRIGRVDCTPVNIPEQDAMELKLFYPNPFSNSINITLPNNQPAILSISDFSGRRVLHKTITKLETISTEHFTEGIYFYELRNEKGRVSSGKVIKQ